MPIGVVLRRAFSGHADYIGQQLDRRPHPELMEKPSFTIMTIVWQQRLSAYEDCFAPKAFPLSFPDSNCDRIRCRKPWKTNAPVSGISASHGIFQSASGGITFGFGTSSPDVRFV